MDGSITDNILTENVIVNEDSLYYNVDKFESGKSNIIFITGLSGAGKTTLANKYATDYNAEIISLDIYDFLIDDCISDIRKGRGIGPIQLDVKRYGSVYEQYFIKDKGKELLERLNAESSFTYEDYIVAKDAFIKYVVAYCLKNKKKKYIIEGVQIYAYIEPGTIKDYPVIALGASIKTALLQRLKRGADGEKINWVRILKDDFGELLSWYWKDNKLLKRFKMEFVTESDCGIDDQSMILTESVLVNTDSLYHNVDKFESGERNVLLVTGLSGSGKSTISSSMVANSSNAIRVELDQFSWLIVDFRSIYNGKPLSYIKKDISDVGSIYYHYLFENEHGKDLFKRLSDTSKHISEETHEDETVRFIKFVLNHCSRDTQHKYIIEGVQIYKFLSIDEIKNYPIIILGTSIRTALLRKLKRQSKDGKIHWFKELNNNFGGLLKWYWSDNKMLNELKSQYKLTESDATDDSTLYPSDVLVESAIIDFIKYAGYKKWKDQLVQVDNDPVDKKPLTFHKVVIQNGYIGIYGINYRTLYNRIDTFYKDKNIKNIFVKKYNLLSYKQFLHKKINKSSVKIDYIYAPEFFALEFINLFQALGTRYKDRVYKRIATAIYKNSWMGKINKDFNELISLDALSQFTMEPTDYQKEFIQNYNNLKAILNLNGYVLAFDQGLGKSFTAVALAECMKKDRVYIVCPNTLKPNWALEIKKYYKEFDENDELWRKKVFICGDNKFDFDPNVTKFIITNNESIQKVYPYIIEGNNLLIVDESHNFRNYNSKRSLELIELRDKLKCEDTLAISGTPIKATPSEITPILRLIDPLFTDEAAKIYTKAFDIDSTVGSSLIQARFGNIMHRRLKEEVVSLPPKSIENVKLRVKNPAEYTISNLKGLIMKRYREIYSEESKNTGKYSKEFVSLIKEYSSASMIETSKYLKLISSNNGIPTSETEHEMDVKFAESFISTYVRPNIPADKAEDAESLSMLETKYLRMSRSCMGKALGEVLPKYRKKLFIALYEENKKYFIDKIMNSTKKTVIFSQFRDVVDYICDDLNANNVGSVKITGPVSNSKRLDMLTQFKEDDMTRVICATSQTMGTGVTLIEAAQMFFFGTPWRSTDFDQCTDRIHRLGQTDAVYIMNILLDSGKELNLSERIDSIIQWSRKMFNSSITSSSDSSSDMLTSIGDELDGKLEESESGNNNMDDILLCENELFYTQDFKIAASSVLYEVSELSIRLEMLEFADNRVDTTYLLEDAAQIKKNIIEALTKMLETIKRLTLKFQNTALSLVKTNEKWVENISKLSKADIAEDFSYTLYPYWKNMSTLTNLQVPDFQENDEFYELLETQEGFIEKYFKALYVTIDGKSVYNPKVAFQGKTDNKVTINKEELIPLIDDMVKFISTYNEKVRSIVKKNETITGVLEKALSLVKRAPINESTNFIEATITRLLEADEPATTSTVEKNDKDDDGISDDKREIGGEKDTSTASIRDISVERQTYAKVCYGVNAARMSAMEGAYNSYVKCLMAAKNSTKKPSKEEKTEEKK